MTSQAEKWRNHRREFELAVAHKITLREARQMRRRDARELASQRMQQTQRTIVQATLPTPTEPPCSAPHEDFDAPWMMRN